MAASLLFTIGDVYDRLGRYDDAERLLVESVALQRNASRRPTLELADALNTLGRLYGTTGNAKKGDGLYLEALQIRRALLRADDPLIAKSLNNLASIRLSGGDLKGAEAGYREALAIMRLRNDPDRATLLVNLSATLFQGGKYAEAVDAAREGWETNEKIHGPDHPTTLKARGAMAWALFSLTEYDRAVEAQRDVVDRIRRVFGDVHVNVAEAWYTLGTMVDAAGRLDDAEHALRESEKVWRTLPGIREDRAAWTLSGLASVLAQKGKYAESEALHHEALALRKRRFGENRPELGESLGGLGHLYYEAAPLLEDGVTILRAKKSGSEDTGYAEGRLAALFDAWGKPEKAAEWRVSLPKKTSSRP